MALVNGSVLGSLKLNVSGAVGSHLQSSRVPTELRLDVFADLIGVAYITEVNAIAFNVVRVEFNRAVDRTVALQTIGSWQINRLAPGIAFVSVLEVSLPEGVITSVDLVTSEMSDAGSYEVRIISAAVTSLNVPVAPEAVAFSGVGVAPEVIVVVATSSTTAEVRFSETIRNAGEVMDAATYVFTNPPATLAVLEVLSISGNVVTLKTGEQDSEILYTLTVDGVIQDNAQNLLVVPVDSPMLGFRTPAQIIEALQLDMYQFLPANLRQIDLAKGSEFIKRFCEGPQLVWRIINQGIIDLLDLWSLVRTRDENVYLLQDILGWAGTLATIPEALEPGTKRRLLQASAEFWKTRGPDDTIENIIRLTTGARARVISYFEFRWVVGETQFGEDHEGTDPWLIANSPIDNEPIALSGGDGFSGTATSLQSHLIAMGEADVLIVFTAVAGHRPVTVFNASPFDVMRFNGIPLSKLGFIETINNPSGREILVEAWWMRGAKAMTGNLEWQFTNTLAPPNSGWCVFYQQVMDLANIFVSPGAIRVNATQINEAMESNTRMQLLSICAGHAAVTTAAPTEDLIDEEATTAVRARVGSRAGIEDATGLTFDGATANTLAMLSLGLLGKPSGVISGGEQEYQVRVVDDGSLDRELVRNLVKVTRPVNERVDIFYVGFLDLFTTNGDKSQWTDQAGTSVVSGGAMTLNVASALESTYVDVDQSLAWNNYSVTWKVKGNTTFDLPFYRVAETDHYFVRVITAATSASGRGTIELWVRNANVNTLIGTAALPTGFFFADGVNHCIRVEVTRVGALNAIKVIVDAEIILSVNNGVHTAGSVGIRRQTSNSGGVLTLDEIELFFLPASVDRIDINL